MTRLWDVRDFDVAATSGKRPPWVWMLLGTSAMACALAAYPLQQAVTEWDQAKSRLTSATRKAQQQAIDQPNFMAQRNTQAAQDKAKAALAIQQYAQVSWDGIFDSLEMAAEAVNGGVSLLSLTPTKIQGDLTQIRVTAVASQVPTMLRYLDVLKHDPRVMQADLVSQHPEDKAGPNIVRFRVDASLNPRVPRPPKMAAQSALDAKDGAGPGESAKPSSTEKASLPPVSREARR